RERVADRAAKLSSGRGQACGFCGDQVIEFWNDCTEHSETPELFFIRQRLWHATHQKQTSDIDRGGPGRLATLRFGVEQSLAIKRSLPIFEERGSDFEAVRIAEALHMTGTSRATRAAGFEGLACSLRERDYSGGRTVMASRRSIDGMFC